MGWTQDTMITSSLRRHELATLLLRRRNYGIIIASFPEQMWYSHRWGPASFTGCFTRRAQGISNLNMNVVRFPRRQWVDVIVYALSHVIFLSLQFSVGRWPLLSPLMKSCIIPSHENILEMIASWDYGTTCLCCVWPVLLNVSCPIS